VKPWHAEARRLREQGLTYREIAERLGRPVGTVYGASGDVGPRRRITRGRRRAAVAALRELDNWSARRIAATLGVSQEAVARDLEALGFPADGHVVAGDGRRYPLRRGNAS
jgi:transcriptional regulator with XRE-family HTH domain